MTNIWIKDIQFEMKSPSYTMLTTATQLGYAYPTHVDFHMSGSVANPEDIVSDPFNYFNSFFNEEIRDQKALKNYLIHFLECINNQHIDRQEIILTIESEIDRITSDLVLKELKKEY